MGFRSFKKKKKKTSEICFCSSSFCQFCLLVSRVGPVSVFGINAEACGSLQTGLFAARNPKLFSLLGRANRTLAHLKSFWVAGSPFGSIFQAAERGCVCQRQRFGADFISGSQNCCSFAGRFAPRQPTRDSVSTHLASAQTVPANIYVTRVPVEIQFYQIFFFCLVFCSLNVLFFDAVVGI